MNQVPYHKDWTVLEAPLFVQIGVSMNITSAQTLIRCLRWWVLSTKCNVYYEWLIDSTGNSEVRY